MKRFIIKIDPNRVFKKGQAKPIFKKQKCGHWFNAVGCSICPTCKMNVKRKK